MPEAATPLATPRDLRVDFLRGLVMIVLISAHVELFSVYSLLTWERVGLVSGAEGFVILSGIVIGMVYAPRIKAGGISAVVPALIGRAAQLYRVNVAIIVSIVLLRAFTIADVHEVSTFTDRAARVTYQLLPQAGSPFPQQLADILLLRVGPHQMQILGLYVALIALSPAALWLMALRRTGVVLCLSWIAYVSYWAQPTRLTGAQFEQAFPLLAWQFLFVHGVAVGYHRVRIAAFMQTAIGRVVLVAAALIALALFVFAQATPNPVVPAWSRVSWLPAETFTAIHDQWFNKNNLRPGRVVNYTALLVVAYVVLGRFWASANKAAGWLLIPIGQASLYVFIVHLYVLLLVSNVVSFGVFATPTNMLLNTVIHTIVIGLLWLMVRYQVLFGWIPR